MTDSSKTVELLRELISIPSLSGAEGAALDFLETRLSCIQGKLTRIPVAKDTSNLLLSVGTPRLIFTTHIDVVPAEPGQFRPIIANGRIYGRGACDAKGCLAAMVSAIEALIDRGESDFGLLVVVEEETSGLGARIAADYLAGSGVQYVINGEPTQNCLCSGQKGALDFTVRFSGKASHSGYPELGQDANDALFQFWSDLRSFTFPSDPELGESLLNIGVVSAGSAPNIISDSATLSGCIRSVTRNDALKSQLASLAEARGGRIEFEYDTEPTKLCTLEGFECCSVSYASDVSSFRGLGAELLMLGPGSISQAHSDNEWVEVTSLHRSVEQYVEIYDRLLKRKVVVNG